MNEIEIHPLSIVAEGAQLAPGVKIGPFCQVGPHVKLHAGVELKSHVVIEGDTTIGENTIIYPFAAIGLPPQDKKYAGEISQLVIGSQNIIREYVTIHPGTKGGDMVTTIGNNGLFMIGVHIAHDCVIGDHAVFANHATLAGHVTVGDYVVIGGLSAVHQFVRIGSHAMVGGMAGVSQDVIPYGVVVGSSAPLSGLNLIGLKRRGFSSSEISSLRNAYRTLFAYDGNAVGSTFQERLKETDEIFKDIPSVQHLLAFIKGDSHRNICMPRDAA